MENNLKPALPKLSPDYFPKILGYQNQGQLQQMYGKEAANIIFSNCASKFIFNPQEIESAKLLADMLGDYWLL